MSVTVSTQPAIQDNVAAFEISSSLSEDASHVNLRVEAALYCDGAKTIKSVKPKGLLDFDFSKILNSMINFKTPDWRTTEGDAIIGVGKSGSNLITGWTNNSFDTLTTSGANITSAIDGTSGGDINTNSFSVTAGKVYALRLSNYSETGADNPELSSGSTVHLRGNVDDIGGIGGVYYFLGITTGSSGIYLTNAASNSVNFSCDCELYEMDASDWFKSYSVTFTEKYENASGVTQSGTPVAPNELFMHFRAEGLESSVFISDYICQSSSDYPLEQERHVEGTYRGATLFRSDQDVSAYMTHVIGLAITDIIFTRSFYDEDGTLLATENTTAEDRYSPIYLAAVSTASFTTTRYKALCHLTEGTTQISNDFLIVTKGCQSTEIPVMLHWINRHGGISTTVFFGDSELDGKVLRDTYKDTARIPKNQRSFPYRQVKVSTDYIPQTAQQEYDRLFWESLLASTSVWIHVGEMTSFIATLVTNSFNINPKRKDFWTVTATIIYNLYEESISAYVPSTPATPDSLGLVGFGSDSLFAYADTGTNPKIMVVDRLTDDYTDGAADTTSGNNIDYRGSLAYCIRQSFARIILFEVSGTINMSTKTALYMYSAYSSTKGFCWIVGQSAPSPGIAIAGTHLYINGCTDVLVQHVTIEVGSLSSVTARRDCVTIYTGSSNVIADRCTFRWGTDEMFSTTPLDAVGCENVTLSRSIIGEGLKYDDTINKDEYGHGYGSLGQTKNLCYWRNLWAYTNDRSPFTAAVDGDFAIINNYRFAEFRPGTYVIGSYGNTPKVNIADVGNVAYKCNNLFPSTQDYGGYITAGADALSKFFFSDVSCKRKDDGYSNAECVHSFVSLGYSMESSSPVDLSDFDVMDSSLVIAWILANTGSKWRDAHDQRILADVLAGTQRALHNDVKAMPARAVNWYDSNGDVSSGFDWSSTGQGFTIAVNGGSALAVTLNANCADPDAVVTHINARLAVAGVTGVEAYKIGLPVDEYVGIRTTSSGASQEIIITSSTVTAIDLQNGTYDGSDALSGGYLTRANNSHALSIPDNPHDLVGSLRRIEVWILQTFDQTAVNI